MIVLIAILPLIARFGAFATMAAEQDVQPRKQSAPGQPAPGNGEKVFATSCAGCHGLDGRGGDRAPSIAVGRVQRLSDPQVFGIIQHGITGTAMPSFHSLTDSDIHSVVAYLRTLQGAKKTVSLPGDPQLGKTLFFGKAGCSSCHMTAGQGGFIASDLSGYARTHSVEEARSTITSPDPNGDRLLRVATVTTRNGDKYMGRIRNEDNFSLQLQDLDGSFHFLTKSDLQSVEYSSQPMMPANYGSTLSSSELNDVISYLIHVANAGESDAPKDGPRDEAPEDEQ